MKKSKLVLREFDGDRYISGGFELNLVTTSKSPQYSFSYEETSTYRTKEERTRDLARLRKLAKKLADDLNVKFEEDLLTRGLNW